MKIDTRVIPIYLQLQFSRYVVPRGPGCWIWTGNRGNKPLRPILLIGNRQYAAHRLSFEIFRGPIPGATRVLHRCTKPLCVHPLHLYLSHEHGYDRSPAAFAVAKGKAKRTGILQRALDSLKLD